MPDDRTAKKEGKSKIFSNVALRMLEKEIRESTHEKYYRNFQTERAHLRPRQQGACFFWKLAAAGFIRLTPTGRTEKSLSAVLEFLMASLSMLKPDTFTGPTWAFRIGTTVRSSALISTVRIA